MAVQGGERPARLLHAELQRKAARGEPTAIQTKTFGEAVELWLQTKRRIRPATRRHFAWALDKHLLPRLSHLKLDAIDTDRIATIIAELEENGLSGSSIAHLLSPLSQVFHYAVRKGWARENPVRLLTRDERPEKAESKRRALEPDEIRRLLRAGKTYTARKTNYEVFLLVAIFTGLRIGELLGMRWSDIDLNEDPVIRVRRQRNRHDEGDLKTGNAVRDVVLPPRVVTAFAITAETSSPVGLPELRSSCSP
jgi:integrase